MCGRMAITLPHDAMARLFGAAPDNDLPVVPNHNVCPTDTVAVVTGAAGGRRLRPMRWGFLPHWYRSAADGPLLMNARAETVARKPAFRDAVRERRCLVPASGFYEWTRTPDGARLPWYIFRADGAPLALAGLWQTWERGEERLATCAIVTTAAGADIAAIHHRMPVIVEPADWPLWLGEAGHGASRLMRPAAKGVLARHRVDPRVNASRARGADLVQPLTAPAPLDGDRHRG